MPTGVDRHVLPVCSFISDGGHIDNTAIIPVLREKPDRIIALDSGDDPNENFGAFFLTFF